MMPPFYAAWNRFVRVPAAPAPTRQSRGTVASLSLAIAFAGALLLAGPSSIAAHEIPKSVTLFAFVRPEGRVLRLVVRVPLEAIRDIQFPLRGPGYLELGKLDSLLHDAARIWIADNVQLYENDTRLTNGRIAGAHVSLPSDRSFETYERAVAHIADAPLPESTELAWQQAMLDVSLEYAIASDRSKFSIDPTWARLGVRTSTVLRFSPPGGSEHAFQYSGDPGLVRLDPRWYQAARQFVKLGFEHILDGIDHLLFLFCLVIPFRKLRPLIGVVTAFTVAHSITLIASAAGIAPAGLWFPPLIEVLIALSIVYMALENIVGPKLERRWMLAFGFGLVHGFGFSFALRESLQFAGSHLLTSLLAFNVGVELGQIAVLCVAIPALALVFKRLVAERMGTIILSALVAHTAWHWMLDRAAVLREYRFVWPDFDSAFVAAAMRGLMLALIIAGAAWMMLAVYRRLTGAALPPAADLLTGAKSD
ncbi:MAG: HupE/UreJ family protein [bacterium]